MNGTFTYGLDLGALGEHTAVVCWSGYRAKRPAEDDYNEMTVTASIDLGGQIIDITSMLGADIIDDMRVQAWEDFPTMDDIRAAEADHWYDERKDERAAA